MRIKTGYLGTVPLKSFPFMEQLIYGEKNDKNFVKEIFFMLFYGTNRMYRLSQSCMSLGRH
jgi:hypothetical protein